MKEILLERESVNRLNAKITKKKLIKFINSIKRRRSLQFAVKLCGFEEPVVENGKYKYRVKLKLKSLNTDEQQEQKNLVKLTETVNKNCYIKDWSITPQFEIPNIQNSNQQIIKTEFTIPSLDENVYNTTFRDIYERESHIRLIHDSVKMFVKTKRQRRSHVLLYGKPAACKTTLFERFKIWYDQNSPDEKVVFLDGPTLTKAGFENWIIEKADEGLLPEIIIIEEIEKQNMDNLLALLSVMQSGYLMKTNARIGRKQIPANFLIWATCNDEQLLKNFRRGSLWSRFTHKWECKRPSKSLMKKILLREIQLMEGDPIWVDKVLEIAYNEEKFLDDPEDPREVIGLLDGQDRLLTGEYLNDLRKIKE